MDLNILKRSVLSACGIVVLAFFSVQLLLWLVANCSGELLAGMALFVLFGLLVKIDYDYRKFLNKLK